MTNPKVFIGSSSEGLKYARAIQAELKDCSLPIIWNQYENTLNQSVLDSLFGSLDEFDFGIFIFSPDDVINIRDELKITARDNVIFELGLFFGRLGKERSFFITPKNIRELHIPSDLQNLITTRFDIPQKEEYLQAELGSTCNIIRKYINNQGCKKTEEVIDYESIDKDDDNNSITNTCSEDLRIIKSSPVVSEPIYWIEDKSNLNYLLLSVVNCSKSREIIKKIQSNSKTEREFSSFELAGMYDIMGKWDLLIRFRLDQNVDLDKLIKLIENELETKGQIEKDADSLFANSDYVNVRSEVTSLNEINSNPQQINHIQLNSTLDYEKQRCQKAFIYVQMPGTNSDRKRLIQSLKVEIENEQDLKSIIEAISISEIAIIFEVFMRCSQTHLLNCLNRAIEKAIPQYRVQKYSLLCFEYDECFNEI